ncbi:Na+/melibiose symporter-like transporter [Phenylobacterium haematophilum]|uniref:Na+/melibiose symporter-like transporter n=1 Tax=Phenylobacterium haematophilum TaxID=98513 RepID=A0A840A358_9CAUL|nr:MFS transporter [Phenylobacterium haematophilum]MBB3891862.1 Na+/melibiose symporter-like transporter [Phenylobacterium haematophilum]
MAHSAAGSTRLPLPVVLAFSSTALPIAAIGLVMAVYLPRFFAGQLGLSLAAVGVAFTIVRLIDLAIDPLLGMAMDRTRTRFGRYRPWLLAGGPIVMVAAYMLFMAHPGITEAYLIEWLLVLYLGVSILTLAQAAWGASLATDYHDRSRVYGVIQAVGVIGAVLILLLPLALGKRGEGANGVHAMGWFCILLIPVTLALCTLFTPERVAPDTSKERVTLRDYWDLIRRPEMARLIFADLFMALGPGTTAALYLFFFHDARGYSHQQTGLLLVFFIGAGLVGAMFWGWLAQKIGKHRALIVSAVAYAASQSALMIIPPATMALAIPGMFAVGFVSSAFVLIVRAMVADVADEVRLETGKERVGLLYALVTTTQKVGTAITVGISFTVLDLVGYNAAEGATNTPEAIRGLELCYVFAPIILVFFGGAAFIGWKLDAKRHAEVRRQLDERDALAAEAALLDSVSGVRLATDAPR